MVHLVSRITVIPKIQIPFKIFQARDLFFTYPTAGIFSSWEDNSAAGSLKVCLEVLLRLDCFSFLKTPLLPWTREPSSGGSSQRALATSCRVLHLGTCGSPTSILGLQSSNFKGEALKPLETLYWPQVLLSPSFQLWICSKGTGSPANLRWSWSP